MTDTLLRLVMVFGSLSILGFGGGKSIIPEMHAAAVNQFHWVSAPEFVQLYSIGKIAPGPTTTFAALIGLHAAGFVGAAITVVALFLPSSLLTMAVAIGWRRLSTFPAKDVVVVGLAPVIVGLLWSSVFSLSRGITIAPAVITIIAVVTILTLYSRLAAPWLIVAGAAGGALFLR